MAGNSRKNQVLNSLMKLINEVDIEISLVDTI